MTVCVFRGTGNGPCGGPPQRHHVVKGQWIKRQYPYGAYRLPGELGWRRIDRYGLDPELDGGVERLSRNQILRDNRNLMDVCRDHHERVTGHRLYEQIPQSVWAFADEFGFRAMLENNLDRRAA